MKTFLLYLLIIGLSDLCYGQHYIGLHKDALADSIKKNQKHFRLDNSTVNKVFKYVKYVDSVNEQTWLFFLDDNDICTHHKLMSDFSNYHSTLDYLNNNFQSTGKKQWEYKANGEVFKVELSEGEWFFTVFTMKKK